MNDGRPDYGKIERLERELGIGQEHERPVRRDRTICLIKNCDGETVELRTWDGRLMYRLHEH